MDIRTVGIVGTGQMGSGIGQVAAQAGMAVLLYDVNQEIVDRALGNIQKGLVRLTDRGKLSPDEQGAILGRLDGTAVLEDLSGADVIIEAAPEDSAIKEDIFRKLDHIARPEVILASNTSSISLTQLGAVTNRPEKVIGMHFMNPPVVMQLVEIVRGLATADETYTTIDGLAKKMGKTTIQAKDYAGFVVNRILLPMINEAIYALYEGVGGVEDIDQGMKLGTNQPMGPLALADLIGLDTCLAVLERLHHGLGDDKYRPCPLLRNYVAAHYLGKKTGKGFYEYR
ncbi:MAG: 3-hydroxybutyryl-CoA dehydrogenase [Desulfurellaceae bacterium]|nr:3-hydroxybutyryl-CoA dehydrogenase [Desulfurellaceae bacterium]